ncbi:MAG: ABC transporter substrate-binding protein [Candidatus Marinimicrobia bacterium]|nr:ABC transporter substrate-binding protein [Candidatus Neomarinimicrobiota bacterium]
MRLYNKNIITKLLIASLLLMGFVGCSSDKSNSSGDKVQITFWHSFVSSTVPALNSLIDEFEKEFPGIDVNAQYVPTGDALAQKLITSVQSNTAPDISWIHAHYLQDLVQSKAIYRMDHFIDGENGLSEETMNDIYPALLQYASWKDTLYSLPMEATNLALLYNKTMFREAGLDPEQPPQTWEELKSYAKKLTFDEDGDGRNDQIGFFVPIYPAGGPQSGWMVWQWMPFLWQSGGYIVNNEQTRVLYNSSAGAQALKLWQDLYFALDLSTFSTDFDAAFSAGHLAMAMDGPWNLPRYKDLLQNLDWAFAPLPAGEEKRATIAGGEYLVIFKQSEHPDAAWQFLKWMTRPETQAKWSMDSGYLPIRHAVLDVPEFQEYLDENPNFKVFVEQMEYAQAQRSLDYYSMQILRHIGEAIEMATVGERSPQEALNISAKKSNDLLDRVER